MTVGTATGEFVAVEGGRVHYVKSGAGPPVLLFHPLGFSTWAWHRVMEPLGRHFTCYALDMLGHGFSDKPSGAFSMLDFAASVAQAMKSLGIARAHVVGNSVGGALGTAVAATYPHRVDRLVLVGAPVWNPLGAADFLKADEANYDETGMPRTRTIDDLKMLPTFVNPQQEWLDKNNETRAQAGLWVRKTMEALAWYDLVARLPSIQASTQVLYGEHDGLREGEEVLRYNIPRATKVVLSGLGHVPQIEDPDAFVNAVLPFLKGETG